MRLKPIENPENIRTRIAYALNRHIFGRVITPTKVIMARVPAILPVYHQITRFMTRKKTLDPSLALLIQAYTAGQNECEFCVDITRSFAAHDPDFLEKVWRVGEFALDPLFTDAERAALQYVASVTQDRDTTDEIFEELQRYFSEAEIVEITLVNAIEHFYNLVNRPLGIVSDGLCALRPHGLETHDAPQEAP